MVRWRAVLASLVCLLVLAGVGSAHAAAKKVLFVSFSGGYNTDGLNAYNELNAVVTATHGAEKAEYVLLDTNGEVAALLATHTYEQIWIYDLSTGTDAYTTDFAAIADWYEAVALREVICDGRFLSSFWSNRAATEGRALVANYFRNLDLRGGGLMLGTDDRDYSTRGMNDLTPQLGFGTFTGNYGGSFPLDTTHPLALTPNAITALSNDSTTSLVPFGLQPNGRTLRTVGYHSANTLTPGISTTIDGGELGITVEIAQAGGVVCDPSATYTASITAGTGFTPFTYAWSIDGVAAGTGASLVVDTTALAEGAHIIKVVATGAGNRADEDQIEILVGGSACACGAGAYDLCGAGGAVFVIAVDGPIAGLYAVCRLVPAGEGVPVATADELRCDGADAQGALEVSDLVDAATLATHFGLGFCGTP